MIFRQTFVEWFDKDFVSFCTLSFRIFKFICLYVFSQIHKVYILWSICFDYARIFKIAISDTIKPKPNTVLCKHSQRYNNIFIWHIIVLGHWMQTQIQINNHFSLHYFVSFSISIKWSKSDQKHLHNMHLWISKVSYHRDQSFPFTFFWLLPYMIFKWYESYEESLHSHIVITLYPSMNPIDKRTERMFKLLQFQWESNVNNWTGILDH